MQLISEVPQYFHSTFRKLLKAHRIQCLLESGGIHRNVFKKIARVVHVIDDSLFASKQIIVIGLNDARD